MNKRNMLLKIPASNDQCVYWKTGTAKDGTVITYDDVRDFQLNIIHRTDGYFDCATRRPDPTKGHFNIGIITILSTGFPTLMEAKLWMRKWYLKKYNLLDIWIHNNGMNDMNALMTRCTYDGDLNIRSLNSRNTYSIIFSNLITNRLSFICKSIELYGIPSVTLTADQWYENRTTNRILK